MISPELAAELAQEHESWLSELEGLAIEAIASNDWTPVLQHLNEIMAWSDSQAHEAQKLKANTDSLRGSGVGFVHNAQND
ncbi:MAG TPA: hypothetical protein V6C95_23555 [Coleofasciculaceae cyanobacterium]